VTVRAAASRRNAALAVATLVAVAAAALGFGLAPDAACVLLFLLRVSAFAAGAVLMVVGLIVGAFARSRAALAIAAAGLAIGLLPLAPNAMPFADRCMA